MPSTEYIKELKLCGDYSEDVVERKCDIATTIVQEYVEKEKQHKESEKK